MFKEKNPNDDAKLVLLGGCRDEGDQNRVDKLKELVTKLKLEGVEFKINAKFDELKQLVETSLIGLQ